jgi:hypothetical protein
MPSPAGTFLSRALRSTGADLPFADLRRPHGTAFEGYYWRFAGSDWSVCAIAGVCRDVRGTWAMVTLASEPDGFVRTEIVEAAAIDGLRIDAGPLQADETSLRVDLRRSLEARFDAPRGWDRPLGPLGIAQLVPWLGQYWAPHLLGARVTGTYDGRSLDGVDVYAEKNWGAAFAEHWWWGQAPGIAFAGGRIHGVAPTAVVAWSDRETIALAPPLARTVARAGGGEWQIRATSPRWRVEIHGEAARVGGEGGRGAARAAGESGRSAARPGGESGRSGARAGGESGRSAAGGLRLPVPIPAERRVELRSNHHLTGQIEASVWRGRRLWLRTSGLAGLEDGAATAGAPAVSRLA